MIQQENSAEFLYTNSAERLGRGITQELWKEEVRMDAIQIPRHNHHWISESRFYFSR